MLENNSRLYDLGFAIHLLKPKSKMPVKSGWTKGPRSSLLELELDYKEGMNVGVRLGTPSCLQDGTFLAVIDCDVKSQVRKHQAELISALDKIFPAWHKSPRVISGRGNGSQHIYIKTSVAARAMRLAQSKEKVEVFMPSTKPSKSDIEALGAEKIAKGLRLRAAWEISLMGDGQQVVLPPSIHPDSGEAYKWDGGISSENDIPVFTAPLTKGEKTEFEELKGFEFSPVEVDISQLDEGTRLAIVDGVGVTDRSISLYLAAAAMVKVGYSDVEIMSVLTNRENYLGQVAYEHCKSDNVVRAARWLARYTVASARKEYSCIADFEGVEVTGDIASEEMSEIQFKTLVLDRDWRLELDRTKTGKPTDTLNNAILILSNAVDSEVFAYNDFTNRDVYGVSTPWGSKAGEALTDRDEAHIKMYISDRYQYEPSGSRIRDAVTFIADNNKFHPVKQYLEKLKWDGVPRIDTWLRDYLGAEENEDYLKAVSRKVLCAMIARIYNPGVKFDYVLILEGIQGRGKSTAIRHLAGDKWFCDDDIDLRNMKDTVLLMWGKWVIELGELSAMHRAEINSLKAFITRSTDNIRAPFGRRTEDFPRQCIFIGSTNNQEYLKDETGNRRFWPVKINGYDLKAKGLLEMRDQLLAEAKVAYESGEALYLDNELAQERATEAQEQRMVLDVNEERFANWIQNFENNENAKKELDLAALSISSLLDSSYGPFPRNGNLPTPTPHAVGRLLRKFGWELKQTSVKGVKGRFWLKTKGWEQAVKRGTSGDCK